ncbi:sugar phosphate nucleotidyltransferase [Thermolongibacillus altinsuensis]|uniref:sugar phosphate nucleotidyltransferase n=1 Tax=Thermolongibacillus altinsuensis TaxID=575256 RepID=UPI00242A2F9B|nr:sugar phosphate nucleotidyltransferase [Thermolongibacillus altinsuensis]GMB07623.1 mannose-1-phosphate guanylyltransferase [Thermolongibacillus altinsuensis]
MKAVIMAGGRGTRLRPLTCHVPKPMVPVMNKPVMEYSIEWLKKFGITEIAVTVQYLSDKIQHYFGDGSRFGVHLYYFEETTPLGTAGSVKHAQSFLDDTFVVISADTITDFNLAEAIHFHFSKKSIATILMHHEAYPLSYGGIITDQNGKIQRFVEKPKWNEVYSDTVNTGIYIFEQKIFEYMEEAIHYDFGQHLFPTLIESGENLYGFLGNGYWSDIGAIEQYHQTHLDVFQGKIRIPISGKEIAPNVWVGNNVYIEEGATINGPVFIGDDVVIHKHAKIEPYTVIGPRSVIGEHASVKRSILWPNVYVDRNSELRGTIVADKVYIGKNSEILDDTAIGTQCKLNDKVKVKPSVKIWPGKLLTKGATVNQSLMWGKKFKPSLFGKFGIKGSANIEMTPEFVAKIASAYGSMHDVGDQVLIGSDHHPFSRLLQTVFTQAMHACGMDTNEYGSTLLPAFRYTLAKKSYRGGVFLFTNERENEVIIDFYDENGYPIDSTTEKKLENMLAQENIRRISLERIGTCVDGFETDEEYVRALIKQVDLSPYKRFKALVCSHFAMKEVIVNTLNRLNCDVVFMEQESDEQIARKMKEVRADFAVIFYKNGESFDLFDDQGNKITPEEKLSLYVIASLLVNMNRVVAVPSYASSALELLAERLNGQVVYVNETRRDMLKMNSHPFHFCFDALYACVQMIQLLSIERCSLSSFIALLPNIHLLRHHVPCSWSERGMVMRKLISEMHERKIDFIDGIKVYHEDGGWTLILPELDEPVLTIYSQAADLQKAKETAKYYIKKIRQYQNA